MKEKKYSISEASRLLEVENHVLRYWEEELELNIPRNEMGHRFYREEEIQLLNCIKELKNKGFQLKAVKEVLPDLEQKKLIDVHKLLATQVELENQEAAEEKEAYREEDEPENGKIQLVQARESASLRSQDGDSLSFRSNEEKMQEFEEIMGRIIGRALRDQAETLGDVMGDRISDRVIREMDDVLDEQEERDEARYKKLDEAIRLHQKARQEIAIAKDEGGRRKSLFFRKNKRKI